MTRVVVALFLLAISAGASAQIARVVSLQGTLALERTGQPPRVLGTGDGVEEKDVVNVAQASHGVLEFRDKTRVTLRPNTIFRVHNYSDSGEGSLVLGLQKGGFRAVSGDIAKRSPTAMRVQTNTTILGVRGTEFDARVCDGDCGTDDSAKAPPKPDPAAVARVIDLRGTVTASHPKGVQRTLVAGATLQGQETITTAPDAHVVLGFTDGTRVTVAEGSTLAIERYAFDRVKPAASAAHMRLVTGNAHVWTGEIAKVAPSAFRFETRAGTIEPHGTGFSANDVAVYTWNGTVFFESGGRRTEVKAPNTLATVLIDGKLTMLAVPPDALTGKGLPRPDGVSADPFTSDRPEDGLYVWVRSGAVVLGSVEIGPDKVGFANRSGARLLDGVPNFMLFDLTPRPIGTPAPVTLRIFRGPDGSTLNTCIAN